MTNETTASQSKSIGDDAQFKKILREFATACYYSGTVDSAELIACIDNFRAPAAQASATIQAGQWVRCTPDLINAGVECAHTPRRPGDGTYSHDHFIAHSAATIQEPVMVAEPVAYADPKAFENFSAGTVTNEWMWANPDAGLVPLYRAAPMVADPAGVAKAAADLLDSANALQVDTDATTAAALTTFDRTRSRLQKALAATVKAVPSEALDGAASESALPELKPGQEWCCGGCGSGVVKPPKRANFEYSREEFPNGSVISKTAVHYVAPCCGGDLMLWDESSQECIAWNYIKIAAPLADKTGGGE